MARTPTTAEESVEAVIISGGRKGEIIRIPQGEGERDLTPGEAAVLDALVADARRLAESAREAAAEANALPRELRQGRSG